MKHQFAVYLLGLSLTFVMPLGMAQSSSENGSSVSDAWMIQDVVLPAVATDSETRGSATARVLQVTPTTEPNELSILMIPGGGLSAQQYLMTPDGRDGWAIQFAKAGYRVYLINVPQLDFAAAPEEGGYEPDAIWPLWGFGPEFGKAYPDSKHPVAYIDQLAKLLKMKGPAPAQAQTQALIEQIGNVVVLGHSAGGRPTFGLADALPTQVRGVVVVEPVPCPTDAESLKRIFKDTDRPMLSVWGDNLDRGRPSMQARHDSCVQAAEVLNAMQGRATTIDLPAMGITGNSHLMMQDINSAEIGAMILDWIAKEVK